jgi:dTDP-4-amino-4,6-dideoxygalactose transaminase
MIPFVDLKAQYTSIKNEIDNAIKNCIDEGNFIKGSSVSKFESSFAEYLGASYCLGCGNGTDALEIILKSLHIGVGDEVIVPALTWISTAEAVNNVGAEPIFVDINPKNYTIDVDKIEEKITNKTKAIIPVHLYGCPADMNEIVKIAEESNLFIIEDCAQAHGAEYFEKKIGTFGIASAFSFFPSKNLGAYGDGGAIITNDKELAYIARKISNHGQLITKHDHSLIGRNSRLDSLQASILSAKLKYLDNWNLLRIGIANMYMSTLSEKNEIILPEKGKDRKHVYHLFTIRIKRRQQMIKLLDERSISWAIHYPKPLPFLDAYSYKKHLLDDFPVSWQHCNEVISLPIYPELTEMQVNEICDQILKNY